MKFLFSVIFLLAFGAGCKQKILSGTDLENKLISTMQNYLDKNARPGVVYKVKDINFYTDKKKKEYNCEFHVNMKVAKTDTIGIMAANISNDFNKVERIR